MNKRRKTLDMELGKAQFTHSLWEWKKWRQMLFCAVQIF